jgi:hypothetical protein
LEIEQSDALTGLPENEQLASPVRNPEPETWIVDPAEAEFGVSAIIGLLTSDAVVWLELVVELVLICAEVEVVLLAWVELSVQ